MESQLMSVDQALQEELFKKQMLSQIYGTMESVASENEYQPGSELGMLGGQDLSQGFMEDRLYASAKAAPKETADQRYERRRQKALENEKKRQLYYKAQKASGQDPESVLQRKIEAEAYAAEQEALKKKFNYKQAKGSVGDAKKHKATITPGELINYTTDRTRFMENN